LWGAPLWRHNRVAGPARPNPQHMSNAKRAAGRHAAQWVEDGMRLGLGTGSTVVFFLEALSERIQGEGLKVSGVPTSLDTERRCRDLRIPLVDLEAAETLDLTVDGADEVDPNLDLIKGGGGALLREKVVASITRRLVIVVDATKCVERLGTTFHLPVEVVPFAVPVVRRRLLALGAQIRLRGTGPGQDTPYRTDNGNQVLDAVFPHGIENAAALERELAIQPGVVESGLFIHLCDDLLVGHEHGEVEHRRRATD